MLVVFVSLSDFFFFFFLFLFLGLCVCVLPLCIIWGCGVCVICSTSWVVFMFCFFYSSVAAGELMFFSFCIWDPSSNLSELALAVMLLLFFYQTPPPLHPLRHGVPCIVTVFSANLLFESPPLEEYVRCPFLCGSFPPHPRPNLPFSLR